MAQKVAMLTCGTKPQETGPVILASVEVFECSVRKLDVAEMFQDYMTSSSEP